MKKLSLVFLFLAIIFFISAILYEFIWNYKSKIRLTNLTGFLLLLCGICIYLYINQKKKKRS